MKTVAVIAARRPTGASLGTRPCEAFSSRGIAVVPINSHEAEVEGIPAYRSVLDAPHRIDMATIYLPPSDGIGVLSEIVEKGIPEVWVNPGADSSARLCERPVNWASNPSSPVV